MFSIDSSVTAKWFSSSAFTHAALSDNIQSRCQLNDSFIPFLALLSLLFDCAIIFDGDDDDDG